MKLFLITQTAKFISYDTVRSMVVRAEDEDQARQEASLKAMDEGNMVWLQPAMSNCAEISLDMEAQVICVDAING